MALLTAFILTYASAQQLEQVTIGLHRPEPHQHIPQCFCLIGHLGLPGQDHAGNLNAVIGFGYLLEEWFSVLRPDQLGFVAFID